ncbi:MAG: hypothetical protein IKQ35_00760 [Bacilli bacterium]|nr:hypothetical protein [Bacilli bacterium]
MFELQNTIYYEFIKNIHSLNSFLYFFNASINSSKIVITNNLIEEKNYEDFISNNIFRAAFNTDTNIKIGDDIVKSVILDYINTILSKNNIKELKGI